jgi:hypothetical protein
MGLHLGLEVFEEIYDCVEESVVSVASDHVGCAGDVCEPSIGEGCDEGLGGIT